MGWSKLRVSPADVLMSAFALVGVGTSYGVLNAKVHSVEETAQELEKTQDQLLMEIRRDLSELKVKMAETARDVEWMRSSLSGELPK